jgi:hypothetical protein
MHRYLYYMISVLLITSLFAQNKIYLDVKTDWKEKAELSPAKNGTIYFLLNSQELGVKEFGEDYSLWLLDYQARQDNDQVQITYTVELRTPALIRKGKLLAKEEISVSYDVSRSVEDEEKELFDKFKKHVKKVKSELLIEAFYCGQETFSAAKRLVNQVQ